jgi:2-oxoglutarate dehydrogenase E2 component (dihydrolipoamide succinyltransferase)
MAIEIKMPLLGESVTEGTVGTWLKQVGDKIEKYEPLLEVISDKVDTEVTATASGVLLSIEVPEGETVPVGVVLCYIGEAGEAAGASSSQSVTEVRTAQAEPPQVQAEREPLATQKSARNRMITPVVARMIAEHKIDIAQVEGTGRDRRVTKRDIETYLEKQRAQPAAVAVPAPAPAKAKAATIQVPPPPPIPRRPVVPVLSTPAPARVPASPAVQLGELIPLTRMRRRIAEHMVQSKRIAPHVTTVFEADLSAIMRHRQANKGDFQRRGIRLTYMAYFTEAVAQALRQHPLANSTFTDEGIQIYANINIGMAAAIEGGRGLLVPVIKQADEKNLLGLARDIEDLTNRARSMSLIPDDMTGGTFTITNHGVSGSLWGTPVINQPQSAILGIGKIQKRVIVTQDDAIAIRPMVYLSFSFDHRVLDGASADAFMREVVSHLEGY